MAGPDPLLVGLSDQTLTAQNGPVCDTYTHKTNDNGGIASITVNGVYAATNLGLSISTDGGSTFTNRNTGNGLGSDDVNGVYAVGTTVYAIGFGGLAISTGRSNTFTKGLGIFDALGVYVVSTTVYAATRLRLSISTDGGSTFTNRTTDNGLGVILCMACTR